MASPLVHFLVGIVRLWVMGASLFLKIPQIITIYRANSSKGISLPSVLLETWSWSMSFAYSFANGYPFDTFMEYPILMAECIILALLVVYTRNQLHVNILLYFALYLTAISVIATGLVPSWIRSILLSCNLLTASSSKIIQLRSILANKDAGKVSTTTWFIATTTTYGRVLTNFMSVADPLMITNFSVTGTLNTAILLSTLYYKNTDKSKFF